MALRLPSDYLQYRELNFCSNVLINVPVPLSVGDQPALLVGRGLSLLVPQPKIWLAAPLGPNSKDWGFVVEASRPLRPLITVTTDKKTGAVEVQVGGLLSTVALRVRATAPDAAVIDELDLRPLGLVVYGNERGLHIGGMMMERNQFANLQVAFAIGTEGQRAGPS
jgi:hypothetical protein